MKILKINSIDSPGPWLLWIGPGSHSRQLKRGPDKFVERIAEQTNNYLKRKELKGRNAWRKRQIQKNTVTGKI